MRKPSNLIQVIILSVFLIFSSTAFAWNHGVSVGYGYGEDINHHTNNNSGGFLSGDFMSLAQNRWVNLTFNGALGIWHSSFTSNQNLFTAALGLNLRFYPIDAKTVHPFLIASGAPAYLSDRHFGQNTQGAQFAFQTTAGFGFEFGTARRFDFNMRLVHFSNAYLIHPNHGFNILYVTSIGYLF